MKRSERKRQIQRVKALAKRWLGPLGLLWWHIETAYYDSEAEFRTATGLDAYMSVCAEWEYGRATISVNLPAIVGIDDERLEFNYVHELGHVFLSEFSVKPDSPEAHHEEHAATVLAKAFIWLRSHCEAADARA